MTRWSRPASGPTAAPVAATADAAEAQIVGLAPPAKGMVVSIILLDSHAEIDVPLPEELPVIDQYGRAFNPEFLLVRRGQDREVHQQRG